ncbi:hypothetical protein DY000_02010598 [Brassica cretica]|uniref:Uncharacterized protein n=1 Tax=Brassica cretica TaxID=69181 RepID=A0ABQ7CE00_BRACR|nr:hypothetical protein DY000_02010598 [Brassica cretica]
MEMKECSTLWRWFDGMVPSESKGWCLLGPIKSSIDMEADAENIIKRDTRLPHAPGLAAGDFRSETQNSGSKLRWGSPCRREKRNEGEKNRWNTHDRREEEKRGNPATANGGAAAGKARRLGYGKVGEERGKREGREKKVNFYTE